MIKPLIPISIQLQQRNIPLPTHVPTVQEDPTTQYVLNNSTQKQQVSTSQLYDAFLLGKQENGGIEETIIEEKPVMKKFVKKTIQF